MTTTQTTEPPSPTPKTVKTATAPDPTLQDCDMEERGLHLISDQIGLISPTSEATGVTSTINNAPVCRDHHSALAESDTAMIAVSMVNNGSGKGAIPLAARVDSGVEVQTNSQTTNTAHANNNLITNEGDGCINNNSNSDELAVPHSQSTTTASSLSSSLSTSSHSSTTSTSSAQSTQSPQSQSQSQSNSPHRVMIPQPSRTTATVLEATAASAEADAEDEAVLNMAAALVSISTACGVQIAPLPLASPPPPPSPPTTNNNQELEVEPCEPGKIKAYAKLHGSEWSFFLKKPSLTMGRAPSQSRQFTAGDSCPVDFYLSSADSLSRTHLRIDYNPDRQRWEMSCLGKSGVKVDKRRYEAFCPPIPIFTDSVITVANATFSFSLPQDAAGSGSSREGSPFERMVRKRKSVDDGAAVGESNQENRFNDNTLLAGGNQQQQSQQPQDDDDEGIDNDADYEDTASLVGVGEYSKPPQSYANLIAEAINSTPNKRMTLSCIYQYLADKYPYFRHTKNGWQNSVRHNLSLNKAFKKVPRGLDEPGKGMLWIIDPDFKHLVDGSIGRRASVRARTPDVGGAPHQRPPLTFIHHHQSMFQQHNGSGYTTGYPNGYPNSYQPTGYQNQQQQQQQNQQHQQQYMLYQQQQMRHPPILPAPDTTHLRPIATIAAAISASAASAAAAVTASPATAPADR